MQLSGLMAAAESMAPCDCHLLFIAHFRSWLTVSFNRRRLWDLLSC